MGHFANCGHHVLVDRVVGILGDEAVVSMEGRDPEFLREVRRPLEVVYPRAAVFFRHEADREGTLVEIPYVRSRPQRSEGCNLDSGLLDRGLQAAFHFGREVLDTYLT